jgi:hypothetical protein
MILNGCTMPSGRGLLNSRAGKPTIARSSFFTCISCLPAKATCSSMSSRGSHQEGKSWFATGT